MSPPTHTHTFCSCSSALCEAPGDSWKLWRDSSVSWVWWGRCPRLPLGSRAGGRSRTPGTVSCGRPRTGAAAGQRTPRLRARNHRDAQTEGTGGHAEDEPFRAPLAPPLDVRSKTPARYFILDSAGMKHGVHGCDCPLFPFVHKKKGQIKRHLIRVLRYSGRQRSDVIQFTSHNDPFLRRNQRPISTAASYFRKIEIGPECVDGFLEEPPLSCRLFSGRFSHRFCED